MGYTFNPKQIINKIIQEVGKFEHQYRLAVAVTSINKLFYEFGLICSGKSHKKGKKKTPPAKMNPKDGVDPRSCYLTMSRLILYFQNQIKILPMRKSMISGHMSPTQYIQTVKFL